MYNYQIKEKYSRDYPVFVRYRMSDEHFHYTYETYMSVEDAFILVKGIDRLIVGGDGCFHRKVTILNLKLFNNEISATVLFDYYYSLISRKNMKGYPSNKQILNALDEYTEKITVSAEEARHALVESGIYIQNGELSENYK